MRIATRCVSCLSAAALVVVMGCGSGGTPPTPTAGSSPAPTGAGGSAETSVVRTVRIVSGADGTPVAGAAVAFENADSDDRSGPGGEVSPSDYIYATYGILPGTAVDVDARGFLPRRTRIERDGVVTLWPVADDAEADAVRRMVYGDQEVRQPFDLGPILVSMLFEDPGSWSPEVERAWQTEALAFGSRFGLRYEWSTSFQYETNEVAVRFATAGGCVPGPASGFCREPSPYWADFVVRPERAGDPATIRRVLASVFLGPNPLPGLLSPAAPADELSPFEEQTIRMVLLRRLPNRWPDTDR
jgi:hypothetical protein